MPKRDEYKIEGRELIHIPTGLPIKLPYSPAEGMPRIVRHRKREMGQYHLKDVLDLGVQILIENGR